MSRLEEIKNEYLKSLGYRNYDHLVADIKSGRSPIEKLILLEDDISEQYAKEVAQASLEKLSYNTEIFSDENYCFSYIDPKILESDDNIVLL